MDSLKAEAEALKEKLTVSRHFSYPLKMSLTSIEFQDFIRFRKLNPLFRVRWG